MPAVIRPDIDKARSGAIIGCDRFVWGWPCTWRATCTKSCRCAFHGASSSPFCLLEGTTKVSKLHSNPRGLRPVVSGPAGIPVMLLRKMAQPVNATCQRPALQIGGSADALTPFYIGFNKVPLLVFAFACPRVPYHSALRSSSPQPSCAHGSTSNLSSDQMFCTWLNAVVSDTPSSTCSGVPIVWPGLQVEGTWHVRRTCPCALRVQVMLCRPAHHDTYFQLMAHAPGCRKVRMFAHLHSGLT